MAASRGATAAAAEVLTVAASATGRSFRLDSLLCDSVSTLARRLQPKTRIAGLDISRTHLSVSISDRNRREAAPFGILCRSGDAANDARSLARAFTHAKKVSPVGSFEVGALVVAAAPGVTPEFEFVEQLLRRGEGDGEIVPAFPEVDAVLFYSQAEALRRAILRMEDFSRAVRELPPRLETRKFGRFATAMHPKPVPDELQDGIEARANISASEVLQAVLDDVSAETIPIE